MRKFHAHDSNTKCRKICPFFSNFAFISHFSIPCWQEEEETEEAEEPQQQQQQVGAAVQCLIYVKTTKINFEKTKNETNSAKT